MKILVVSANPPGWGDRPVLGGAERRAHRVVQAWARTGHDVALVGGPGSPAPAAGERWRAVPLPLPPYRGDPWTGWRATRAFRDAAVAAARRLSPFDAVVAATSSLADVLPARDAARAAGVPWVVVVGIDQYAPTWLSSWRKTRRDGGAVSAVVRATTGTRAMRLARDAARALCVSRPIADSLRDLLPPERVVVTGIGVDRDAILRAPVAEPRDLVYLGRIEKGKGVETALRVLARLDASSRLAFVGHGGWRAEAERLAEELGVASRVEWLGYVPGDERFSILRSARAMLFPSHSEGFGLAVAESVAAGVPVALFDGVARNFPEAPGLFPAREGDVDDLAAQVERARRARSPALAEAMGAHAKRWSWDEVAAADLEQIRRAVEGRR